MKPTTKGGCPQNLITRLARVSMLAGVLFCTTTAPARPRLPLPQIPEFILPLYTETFDWAFEWSTTNAQVTVGKYTYVESWSGYALQRSGTAVAPFFIPAVDSGHTNLSCNGAGTIRIWFKPATWSSVTQTKGTGPGAVATLLELDAIGKNQSANVWSLQLSADGTALALVAQSDDHPTLLLQTEISWPAQQSHLIALDYSPKETTLFIDGQIVAQGAGVPVVPPELAALFVGSSLAGKSVAGGDFDELFCFGVPPPNRWGRPARTLDMPFYWTYCAPYAALGPISAEEIDAREKRIAARKARAAASKSARSAGGGGMEAMAARGSYGSLSVCATNVPIYITNVWAGFETEGTLTVTFDVVGGTNGLIYDVFGTTNLAGGSLTNMPWVWVTNTPTCSTVVLTNQSSGQTFYILGTPLDSDGDGLTDAYERLVSHTDPYQADTDGDGIPDGWAVYLGLNPNGNDPGNSSLRANFDYTLTDWLNGVTGIKTGSISSDNEGNVTAVSQ